MIKAFEALFGPLLHQVCNDPRLKQVLDPALTRQQMKSQRDLAEQQKKMEAKIDRLLAQNEGLMGILRTLAEGGDIDPDSVLTLPELNLLAERFGGEGLTSQESVLRFLILKAEEYEALKSEVDAIDDGLKRLSNLKAAAQGAIARVDLEEVEELLSRVQEVELEEAAKTAELRANNALLRGRVEQAYQILSAAADSFAAVDPVEPARRRVSYEDSLYAHGLRYGGQGMALSEAMLRNAIDRLDKTEQSKLWATAQNALAIALQSRGTRAEGAAGTNLLAEAAIAYNAALTFFTKDAHPVEWAMTQNNLGAALQEQGTRTEGAAGTALLADAVTALNTALTVRTEDAHPVVWAMTQNNLGTALSQQGTRTDGAAGIVLLADAVIAYNAALTIYTKDALPVHWAVTQENLAITEEAIADHDTTTDPRPHLEAALAHVETALTVFDPTHMSYRFEQATRLREDLQQKLNTLSQV